MDTPKVLRSDLIHYISVPSDVCVWHRGYTLNDIGFHLERRIEGEGEGGWGCACRTETNKQDVDREDAERMQYTFLSFLSGIIHCRIQ